MTYDELVTLTTLIAAAQNISFVDDTKTQVWFSLLEDLDYKAAHMALKKLLRVETHTITPAHIRKACAEIETPLPDTAEAWRILTDTIRFGRYQYHAAIEYAEKKNTIIAKIVKDIGFNNLCDANAEFLRQEFEKLYREVSAAYTRDRMLTPDVKKGISALSLRLSRRKYRAEAGSGDETEGSDLPLITGDVPGYAGLPQETTVEIVGDILRGMRGY